MYKTLGVITLALLSSVAMAAPDTSKLPAPSDKKDLSFTNDIAPILKTSCLGCHGAERQRGGLRLDTLEMAMKGGKSGPVIVSGKSDQSALVISVARIDSESAMPPMRRGAPAGVQGGPKPLTAEEVGLIRAWIDQGAK